MNETAVEPLAYGVFTNPHRRGAQILGDDLGDAPHLGLGGGDALVEPLQAKNLDDTGAGQS